MSLSPSLVLAPVSRGQSYTRCGTMGPEAEWRVTLSADGAHLAAITSGGTVRLFATASWRELAHLASPIGRVDAVAFSPDGAQLATLSAEAGQATLWRAHDGELLATFWGPPASSIDATRSALAFSSNGRRLATSLGTLIDLETGVQLRLGKPDDSRSDLGLMAVKQLRFTAAGATVFAETVYQIGHSNQTMMVALYDATTGRHLELFAAWYGFEGAALSPDGRLVAVARSSSDLGYPRGLSLHRADDGVLIDHMESWSGRVLAFTPDGGAIVGAADGFLTVRDLRTWKAMSRVPFPPEAVFLGFSSRRWLVTSGEGGTTTWDVRSGAAVRTESFRVRSASWTADGTFVAGEGDGALFRFWRAVDGVELCAPASAGTAGASALAISVDGHTVAVGRTDGVVELWDGEASERRGTVETRSGSIKAVSLSADGGRLATRAADSNDIQVRTARDGQLIAAIAGPPGVDTFVLSQDGGAIAASAWGTILVSEVATGTLALTIRDEAITRVASFRSDGQRLAAIMSSGVRTWQTRDGSPDAAHAPPGALCCTFALSPDWSVIAGSTAAGLVAWRTIDGGVIHALSTIGSSLCGAAALSPDGSVLVAELHVAHTHATDWCSLRLWDVATGTERRSFGATDSSSSRRIALAPDGRRIFTLEAPGVAVWCR